MAARKKKKGKGRGKPAVVSLGRRKGSIKGRKYAGARARRSAKASKSAKRSYR